ncbi:MAG: DNRLRE domain-containing protein [Bacteroidetes bacterium]|nr:DNRLRE domain-containing protein [Bacteroidota bacterium]
MLFARRSPLLFNFGRPVPPMVWFGSLLLFLAVVGGLPQAANARQSTDQRVKNTSVDGVRSDTAPKPGAITNPGATTSLGSINPLVTVSFQDGVEPSPQYDGTRDTKILSTNPTTAYGLDPVLEMDAEPDYAVLISWDLSSLPKTSRLVEAALIFEVTDKTNLDYEFYAVNRWWDEDVTSWVRANGNQNWQLAGAKGPLDHSNNVLGTVTAATTGSFRYELRANAIAQIQDWIDNPGTNYGFIFQDFDSGDDGLDFASREAINPGQRPRLELIYSQEEVIPEAPKPPVAAFDMRLLRGSNGSVTMTADASPSTDPDGQIARFDWDFGDGQSSQGHTASGANASHTFQVLGTHLVTLTVTDNDGLTSSTSRPVFVDVHGENQIGFQDGVSPLEQYAGTRDTKILSGTKTSNYGAELDLEMDGSPLNVALIKWDLTAIAPGVDVLNVVLTFDVTDPSSEIFGVFALRTPWEESTSTWMEAAKGSTWQLDGAGGENDFFPKRLADLGPAQAGPLQVTLDADGRDRVEAWINVPASNQGFVLKDYTSSNDGLDLSSREAALLSARPRIQITYQSQHHAELPQKLRIEAYPNPFEDQLTINLASPIHHDVRVELYDLLGRLVDSRDLSAGVISGPIGLRTGHLAAGVYALRIIEHQSIVSSTRLVTKGR